MTYGSGYPEASFDSTWDSRSGYGAAGAEAGTYRRFDSDRGVWVGGEEGEGTTERVKAAVSDASDRARETLSSATGRAREKLSSATDRARETLSSATGRARETIGRCQRADPSGGQPRAAADRPVPAVRRSHSCSTGWRRTRWRLAPWQWRSVPPSGLALPETRREQELMGDARDRMVDNAKSMANTAVDRATEAAQNLVGTAKGAADTTEQHRQRSAGCHQPRVAGGEGHHQQGRLTPRRGFGSGTMHSRKRRARRPGAFNSGCRARAASARTALTIPIRPIPFPIEMF